MNDVLLVLLLLVLTAAIIALAMLHSRDLKQLADGLHDLVQKTQQDGREREQETWLRAQKEIELYRRFTEDLHARLARRPFAPTNPNVESASQPPPLPPAARRSDAPKPRRDMDLATVGT